MAPSPRSPLAQARSSGAAVLTVLAALWIARTIAERRVGAVNVPESQARLEELERTLAPLAPLLPPDEPLRYAWPLDSRGRPLFPNDFTFVLAILAPRRIGHELEARYVLAHHRSPEGFRLLKGLADARRVAEFGPGFTLLERAGP